MEKTALIIGGGPAGLTAALELLRKTDIHPVVLEKSHSLGGISRTVNNDGNRMDIGGHRFFSKNEEIMRWWQEILPIQGSPSSDDILLGRTKDFQPGGPDPEVTDNVMLIRERISRIYFLRHFFDYPISMKWDTFKGMGLVRTMEAGLGYLKAAMFKKPETNLENFYINRFGRPLYSMFFEDYTEKVWGVHPSQIGADWGAQRVKGLSVSALLKDIVTRPFRSRSIDQKNVETSLIEQFIYPKYGPGQLWETVGKMVQDKGGEIRTGCNVVAIHADDSGNMKSVDVSEEDGSIHTVECDYVFSSMPLKELVDDLRDVAVPDDVKRIAEGLPYRDFMTVGLLVKRLKILNSTRSKTFENRVPDTWIYVQERDVKVGRLQIFNNWSPYMVKDYKGTMYISMEYFCNEGDGLWSMEEDDFKAMATEELVKIGVVDKEDVIKTDLVKVKKAYPAYFGAYKELGKVREYLDGFGNLFCIGRNGQHRYNNMDHSMLTAMNAVMDIKEKRHDKENIWNVNTEEEYHESKRG